MTRTLVRARSACRTEPAAAVSGQSVSAREAEVLAAVSEHLTNAEIAERFFISVRTVESHVSSLLRKLQVRDRRALASMGSRPPPLFELSGCARALHGHLPPPLTSFVGRDAEVRDLRAALAQHRLVNVVGPGGVGKTRLAVSVAAGLDEHYSDGAWFVDLTAVAQESLVLSSIATVLGLDPHLTGEMEAAVLRCLAPRESLLVLDTCEHLLEGLGVLLERLLAACPRLTILTTSRARLLLPFEWTFPLHGLSSETGTAGTGDAVELFFRRAVASGTTLTPTDAGRVGALCEALEGVPLAIELAAARLPSLGLDGLEAGLPDPLGTLTGGSRGDERHRSLRATLDWSYWQLDALDRALLRRVSVFAAPFTAEAVAVVAGWTPLAPEAVASRLAGLVDQSLMRTDSGPGVTRYWAAEPIRQYGAELTDDAGEVLDLRSRHFRWCQERAETLLAGMLDEPRPVGWRTDLGPFGDEVTEALTWAAGREGPREGALRLAQVHEGLSSMVPHREPRLCPHTSLSRPIERCLQPTGP